MRNVDTSSQKVYANPWAETQPAFPSRSPIPGPRHSLLSHHGLPSLGRDTACSPITAPPTCSLVVRPLATSTTWNPVRPATGMKNKPATHITAILKPAVKESRVPWSGPPRALLWPPSLGPPPPPPPAPSSPATHRPQRIRDGRADPGELLHVVEDVEEAEAKPARDVGRQGEQEEEEVTVVPAADAVVHPGAVVVELLWAARQAGATADRTKRCSERCVVTFTI